MSIFSSGVLEQTKQRMAQATRAANVFSAVRARADAWLSHLGDLPTQAGGWMHQYVCPEHWGYLLYDPNSSTEFRCPHGETFTGEPFAGGWRVLRHRQAGAMARDLGLLYALAGNGRYAAEARHILEHYARFYPRFEGDASAQPWMLKGRAFHQALTEAIWAVPIAQAYDLIRPALAPDDKANLINGLLRPIVETLVAAQDELVFNQNKLTSNYNAWLIAALGSLGYALSDAALVARELDGPAGFCAHLAAAIRPDGFEHEGTPYYHNFVALAYTILAETARMNDRDLYAERGPQGQSIEAMWSALASLAYPDGSLPEANDGAYWARGPFAAEVCEVYEVALARTNNPLFAQMLNRHSASQKHDHWTALLFGTQDLAEKHSSALPSARLVSSGFAVLRNTGAQAACIPFGPYGGAHGHFDRLALNIWPWSVDAGTPPYGVKPRQSWYQQTAAHNAVVVDGQSQAPCAGKLLSWNDSTVWLSADDAFPGVRFSRLVTLIDNTLTDLAMLDSDAVHTFDWLLHVDGECEFTGLAPASGKLAESEAYQFITLVARGRCEGTLAFSVRHQAQVYRLSLTADTPFEMSVGNCPSTAAAPTLLRTSLIARVRGRRARFLLTSTSS